MRCNVTKGSAEHGIFIGMVSTDRQLCARYQDGADFANALMHNRESVNLPKLRNLVELASPGDGKWLSRIVKDLDVDQLTAMTDRIALALKKRAS
jgi:hypothetical protein